ncbi:MAG: hypothetical protein HY314_06270 [Acidobacteria bacterium]|nr:hypothetical protein [Acidobacteriota bacterium]
MSTPAYPWYQAVSGDDIEQGDILDACPVFLPPEDLAGSSLTTATFRWEERDVIVLSQSCDMVKGREKISEVLLCAIWKRSELTEGHLATNKGMEDARRGNLPGFHVLAECTVPGFPQEVRVVDFRRVYSLPLAFARKQAVVAGSRIRLLPPYREHLSQAFARFFMRVGLPVDIPPFK